MYFDQSSYTVAEGEGPLEVCVAIDGALGVTVDVNLSSQDGTAEGITQGNFLLVITSLSMLRHNSVLHCVGDDDYDVVNEVFIFSPEGDPIQCLNISIIDDELVENTEIFTLLFTVSADYNARVLSDKPATVTILDNDEQITDDILVAPWAAAGIVFLLFVLVIAGGISCLVVALNRRQR